MKCKTLACYASCIGDMIEFCWVWHRWIQLKMWISLATQETSRTLKMSDLVPHKAKLQGYKPKLGSFAFGSKRCENSRPSIRAKIGSETFP